MTGGWAATNTLRRCIEHDDLLRDKALAAVALVEAALDAAGKYWANLGHAHWCSREEKVPGRPCDCGATALAAALRAVREGK